MSNGNDPSIQKSPPPTDLNDVVQTLGRLETRLNRIEQRLEQPMPVRMGAGDTVVFGCWLSLGLLLFSVLTALLLFFLGAAGVAGISGLF